MHRTGIILVHCKIPKIIFLYFEICGLTFDVLSIIFWLKYCFRSSALPKNLLFPKILNGHSLSLKFSKYTILCPSVYICCCSWQYSTNLEYYKSKKINDIMMCVYVFVFFFVFGFLITHGKNTRVHAVPWTRLDSTHCRFYNSTSLVNATQDYPPSLSAALDTSFIARVHSVVELSIFESINSRTRFCNFISLTNLFSSSSFILKAIFTSTTTNTPIEPLLRTVRSNLVSVKC